MTYAEKLRDSRWQKKRLKVFERDSWTCCECNRGGAGITLNVHHRFYKRCTDPWSYGMNWLETLCESCHGRREDAIESLHVALLPTTTGELMLWAKRISKELKTPKRKHEKQAALNKLAAPSMPVFVPPVGGKSVWDNMRAAANGLVALQEVRNA